jgi:hypothetical protein
MRKQPGALAKQEKNELFRKNCAFQLCPLYSVAGSVSLYQRTLAALTGLLLFITT